MRCLRRRGRWSSRRWGPWRRSRALIPRSDPCTSPERGFAGGYIIEAAGADLEKPVITSCGSGVTAAILSLALERIGHRRHALYDGSWAEWGMPSDLKVETG